MRPYLLIFCLLAATACDEKSPAAPTGPLNERVTLARGDAAVVTGTDFRLQFLQVTGDSRCPADAVCIQGGDAIVHIRATDSGGTSSDFELHTGDSSRAAVVYRAVRIELVELQPYPFSSRTIQPDEYRATLVLTRP